MTNIPDEQPGSKFGTQPYQAGTSYDAPMGEPVQYRRLKSFTLISAAFLVLSTITGILLAQTSEYADAMRDSLSGLGLFSAEEIDEQVEAAQGVGFDVTILVLTLALYALVFFGLRAEKNWARIVGIIFAILGVLFTLGGVALSANLYMAHMWGIATMVLTLLYTAATVYWLVLAFSGRTRAYLADRRAS